MRETMVLPDKDSKLSKKAQVADMFDHIAGRYDFLNHFLSLNIDKGWRRKAIREVMKTLPAHILDVATGTADMAIAAAAAGAPKITGIDISEGMLEIGRKKISASNLASVISLETGDSEGLRFADESFDAVMCAYGVRNFEHLETGLRDMHRVLKPGGRLVILEFSHPRKTPVKQLYRLYSKYILPTLGNLVSRHSNAYTYLPESVAAFPEYTAFVGLLERCGYRTAAARPLTFGITTLFTAVK